MADQKISALTSASTPLAGTEVLPIVQSGSTVKVSVANLTAGRAVSTGAVTASGNLRTEYSTTGNVSLVANNTNATAAATSQLIGINDTGRAFRIQYSSSGGFGGGALVNGITTEAAQLFTDNGYPVVLGVGSTASVILDTSFNARLVSGNLIQGTAAKGINFTANTPAAGMTSQLLNWYEEGTWTPAMTFSVSQGDLTYGVQTGRYTRIGRSVVLNCSVRVTETTASGNITITGLPFTSSSAIATATACFVDNVSGVSGAVVAQLNGASSTITLFYTGTGSSTQLSNTNTGTNSSFQFVLNYIV